MISLMSRFTIAFTGRMASALDDYRWERDRQIRDIEKETGGYAGDEQHRVDHGGQSAITLKDWMKSRKPGPGEMSALSEPMDPNHTYTPHPSWNEPGPAW